MHAAAARPPCPGPTPHLPTGPLSTPAGPSFLSAQPCNGTALHVQQAQDTGHLRFKLTRAGSSRPTAAFFSSPVRIISYSHEAQPGCPAVLGLSNATAARQQVPAPPHASCGLWAPALGGPAGRGAEQWVLEDARPKGSNSTDVLVRIRMLVRVGQVCQAGGGALHGSRVKVGPFTACARLLDTMRSAHPPTRPACRPSPTGASATWVSPPPAVAVPLCSCMQRAIPRPPRCGDSPACTEGARLPRRTD